MREIASGDDYDTRTDLGNTPEVDGDGRLYAGRGPIQVTGKANYRKLSEWAFGKGYVKSPTYFVDHPQELEKLDFAFLGAVWYWTVARAFINSLCDKRDIVGVTEAINGGQNGLADRKNRYNNCMAMGLDKLNVNAIEPEELEQIVSDGTLYRNQSIFRNDNNKWMNPIDTIIASNAMIYESAMIVPSAKRGEQWAIALIVRTARGESVGARIYEEGVPVENQKYDEWAIKHAQDILREIKSVNPEALAIFEANEKGQK